MTHLKFTRVYLGTIGAPTLEGGTLFGKSRFIRDPQSLMKRKTESF